MRFLRFVCVLAFAVVSIAGVERAHAGLFGYSELGINMPSSGGEYVYLTRAYGPTWGFMTGWVSFFAGFSAPIAFGDPGSNEGLTRTTYFKIEVDQRFGGRKRVLRFL